MKVLKYVRSTPHRTGPIDYDHLNEHRIHRGDIITLLATVERMRIIMMPSGTVRYLGYNFEEQKFFVEICP